VATHLARCKNLHARHIVEGVVSLPLAGFGEGHARVVDAANSIARESCG